MVIPLETQINSILSFRKDPKDKESPRIYSEDTIKKAINTVTYFQKYAQKEIGIELRGDHELLPGRLEGIDIIWIMIGGGIILEVPKEGNDMKYEGHIKSKGYIHGDFSIS